MTAGSSVPEAARAAVSDVARVAYREAVKRQNGQHYLNVHLTTIDMAVEHAAPFIVAAASVELQQEVDRLSAECEALRGTVAEERATTGLRVDALGRALREIGQMTGYGYSSGIQDAVDVARAALASPGEES